MEISEFQGEYRFLSNFWPAPITIVGIPYKNVEAAYQASKSNNIEVRKKFSGLEPHAAKALGRQVHISECWTDMAKIMSMELCLRAKFNIPELRARLISLAGFELVEGNNWNDTFWGVCRGTGRNVMGKLLMSLRDELIAYEPQYARPEPIRDNNDIPF